MPANAGPESVGFGTQPGINVGFGVAAATALDVDIGSGAALDGPGGVVVVAGESDGAGVTLGEQAANM